MRTTRLFAIPAAVAALFAAALPASAAPAFGTTAINTLANQQSKRCLDDSFAYGVRTYPCNGTNFQRWSVTNWGDGTREFRNVDTRRCLAADANGTVYTGECDAATDASWYVKWWNDGTFELKNQRHSQCLEDVVWLWTRGCNFSREQSWF